jgi:hypothetical protein
LDPGVPEYGFMFGAKAIIAIFFLQAPSFAVKISMCSPVGIFYLSLPLEDYFFHKLF